MNINILYLVPCSIKKGTQLASLNWPESQHFNAESVNKVPSWYEKSTHLLHENSLYFRSGAFK